MRFPVYIQHDGTDCGPTCIRIIAKYYGKDYSLEYLRKKCQINAEGVSLLDISRTCQSIGFKTEGMKLSLKSLQRDIPLPTIVHWENNHFVIVYKFTKNKVYIVDPREGKLIYTVQEFAEHWIKDANEGVGFALSMIPEKKFFDHNGDGINGYDLKFVFKNLFKYRSLLIQLVIGLTIGNVLVLFFPFLTKAVVDLGIGNQDIGLVNLILIGQLTLHLSKSLIDILRGWILLHISSRVNISIISEFLAKMMKLPLSFFESKTTGDLINRVEDHSNINELLTGPSLTISFSLLSNLVFAYVLASFSVNIFLIFLGASILYVFWLTLFMRRRRALDFKHFRISSENRNVIIQIINGINELKIANSEELKRRDWEHVQAKLFKWNITNMKMEQVRSIGSFFINEGKNIFITYIAALSVIKGEFTLGTMLAIQYIIGQMNTPIQQLIILFKNIQDAQISLERMSEIKHMDNEINPRINYIQEFSSKSDITIENLSFSYPGSHTYALQDLNIKIPRGKVTALVGSSGSGKTTLLKLLLKFYEIEKGLIKLGDHNWQQINPEKWRSICGVVMQEGFLFNDTLANNIALGLEVNYDKLNEACRLANIKEVVDKFPLGFHTTIGSKGFGLSRGQIQRILMARAIYKNPWYVMLDEATNALDAKNEKVIINNLNKFFKGRTVIVAAHRLSTIKHADQILVIEQGKVVEQGDHQQLIQNRSHYYNLVKNQLELSK